IANAKERIKTGSGIGVTVNASQIIERNPRPLKNTEANMETSISPSLTTVPAELSGDGFSGGLHFVPSMETVHSYKYSHSWLVPWWSYPRNIPLFEYSSEIFRFNRLVYNGLYNLHTMSNLSSQAQFGKRKELYVQHKKNDIIPSCLG
ncbi:hypothetical protein MKW92_014569, partial [Papaver armeniacum]